MNLSAPFLSQFFSEPMLKVMALSNLVFGNETEAVEFSKKMEFGTEDIKEIALKISKLELKGKGSRTVVITQGNEPVVVALDGKTIEFPVTALKTENIVDTNGAGDAFVGGYLAQLVQGRDLDTCVRCGIWAATEIIQRSGCTMPEKMTFK